MKTKFDTVQTAVAVAVTACVVAISSYLVLANIGQPWVCGVAVAIMTVAWLARRLSSSPNNVGTSLIMAGSLLSVALGMKALEHLGWVNGTDIAARTTGIMTGIVLVLLSNAIPKRVSSASALSMFRIVGTAFVVGGFGYACAWLVLPISIAATVAVVIVLASILVAAVSYISWQRSGDRSAS